MPRLVEEHRLDDELQLADGVGELLRVRARLDVALPAVAERRPGRVHEVWRYVVLQLQQAVAQRYQRQRAVTVYSATPLKLTHHCQTERESIAIAIFSSSKILFVQYLVNRRV